MLNRVCRFPSADNKGKQLKLTYVLLLSQLLLFGSYCVRLHAAPAPGAKAVSKHLQQGQGDPDDFRASTLDFLASVGLHQILSGPSGRG